MNGFPRTLGTEDKFMSLITRNHGICSIPRDCKHGHKTLLENRGLFRPEDRARATCGIFLPEGACDLPSQPALRGKIRELALYYRDLVNSDENSDVDAVFMYAALSHLLNDFETAQTAIQVAIDLGDDSSSAENLKKLLG